MAADSVLAVDGDPACGLGRREAGFRTLKPLDHVSWEQASGVDQADAIWTQNTIHSSISTYLKAQRQVLEGRLGTGRELSSTRRTSFGSA